MVRAKTLEECELRHAEMVRVQKTLTEELKQVAAENERLQAAMSLAIDEGRKRDELVLKNKELHSARHFDKINNNNKLRQQWHEHLLIMKEVSSLPG